MEYRNELKFEVADHEMTKIYYRLRPLMQGDRHQGRDGYSVRSLYFDDLYDSCMNEKENGVGYRTKYRIRIYNGNSGLILLEKKIKYRQMTRKETRMLTRKESDALMSGDMDFFTGAAVTENALLRELSVKMLQKKMRPKCIVEYDRFAFVEDVGNVRITFDRNICGSGRMEQFYDQELDGIPVMPVSRHILEIKYDELLPQYILQAVELGNLHRQSFSKYFLAMQSNLVISLGMVGALSIVRFRTAIKEPMDLLFLFWSIGTGIICGAGLYRIALLVALITTFCLVVLQIIPIRTCPYLIIVNAEDKSKETEIINIVKKYSRRYRVDSKNIREHRLDLIIEIHTKEAGSLLDEVSEMESVKGASLLYHDSPVKN